MKKDIQKAIKKINDEINKIWITDEKKLDKLIEIRNMLYEAIDKINEL